MAGSLGPAIIVHVLPKQRGRPPNERGRAQGGGGADLSLSCCCTLPFAMMTGTMPRGNRLRAAFRDAGISWVDRDDVTRTLPDDHVLNPDRVYCRRAGFFSREGVCAASSPAYPAGAVEGGECVGAIFSGFEPAAVAPAQAGGGVAAAAAQAAPVAGHRESSELRY